MTRTPVTIAILAWNSWSTTRTCLDTLRPTLGPRDQVVVVDNGSVDATPAGLKTYPWIEVVSNAENRGFAGGCNDAARVARNDVIIFLNNDTALTGKWIDPLCRQLAEGGVGGAGPRSNFVSGPQVVDTAAYDSLAGFRRFARDWMQSHRGQATEVERLVGFCIAVRRDAYEAIGGFDESYGIGGFEDDDLCQRLMNAGWKLAICHDSFVHHDGHRSFDANGLDWHAEQESNRDRFISAHGGGGGALVSACLIVKDEQERLGGCLQSLRGVVDEVVVYDTGSTDGTVALARAAGATVIEGYWDDDFSRARNAALEHCSGEWVAWLDADETLEYDSPEALRSLLVRTKDSIDGWSVSIHNLTGSGAGAEFVHHATRIFRRERCEWTGRLHEQITRRGGGLIQQAELSDGAHIRHTGYLAAVMAERNKVERNLRVAEAEIAGDSLAGEELGYALTSLGRSLVLAGRAADGIERLNEAMSLTANGITRRLAIRSIIDGLVALRDLDGALEWCDRFRQEGAERNTADAFEATVRLERGEWSQALDCLERVEADRADPDGFAVAGGQRAAQRSKALSSLGRTGEAADTLLQGLAQDGVLDTHLGNLVDFLQQSGRGLSALPAAIPSDRLALFCAQVLQLETVTADLVLEACLEWAAAGGAARVDLLTATLATASRLALRLPVDRALMWSARVRAAGQPESCPLVAYALSDAPALLRARAAATAAGAFADPRAVDAFWRAYGSAPGAEQEAIRSEAGQLCPSLMAGAAS